MKHYKTKNVRKVKTKKQYSENEVYELINKALIAYSQLPKGVKLPFIEWWDENKK